MCAKEIFLNQRPEDQTKGYYCPPKSAGKGILLIGTTGDGYNYYLKVRGPDFIIISTLDNVNSNSSRPLRPPSLKKETLRLPKNENWSRFRGSEEEARFIIQPRRSSCKWSIPQFTSTTTWQCLRRRWLNQSNINISTKYLNAHLNCLTAQEIVELQGERVFPETAQLHG